MTATPNEAAITRRVVTGHDAHGKSIFVADGAVPVHRYLDEEGVAFHELWQTESTPAVILPTEPDEPTQRSLRVPPPPGGTKVRINVFEPGFVDAQGRQSPVHRTESVDYGIVLEGEVVLMLDDSEVTLSSGDVVVQRGTDHAWANRSDRTAKMAFILIDGSFASDLLALLPEDARSSLLTEGLESTGT